MEESIYYMKEIKEDFVHVTLFIKNRKYDE